MNKIFTLCLLVFLTFIPHVSSQEENADLVIVNAAVVDVTTGDVIRDQLILISGDTIRRVEPTGNRNNYTAGEVIDAEGKYVIPGLWDMHVHFRGGDTLVKENRDLLPLFLAHGITTVRDAGGDITSAVLQWREEIAAGNLAGPHIFTSGPKLDGPDPAWEGSIRIENEQDIEAALDSLEALGADYVKMYDGSLSEENFYNVTKAAESRGLKTTGHMPMSADLLRAVDYGLDGSEHLYYVLKACSPKADSLTRVNPGYGMMNEVIETYDPQLAQQVFQKLKENEVYITPTLHIGQTLSQILEVDHSKDSLLPYIGSGIQKTYRGRIEGAKRARAAGSTMREKMEEKTMEMMKPMFDAGVNLLAGSDCGPFNSYVYPGGSLLGELKRFVEAGLTPREALSTSILKSPEFFELQDFYGSIAPGKVADIMLLDENPLEDIAHLESLFAVIKRGEVYNRQQLRGMLEEISSE